MPILLINMLVGLAVGDIKTVQDEAGLKRLELQVQVVLTVEEILRFLCRCNFVKAHTLVYPNRKKRGFNQLQRRVHFFFWGGERYDKQRSILKVLRPHKKQSERLREEMLNEVKSLKSENRHLREQTEKMADGVKSLKEMMEHVASRINREGSNYSEL